MMRRYDVYVEFVVGVVVVGVVELLLLWLLVCSCSWLCDIVILEVRDSTFGRDND